MFKNIPVLTFHICMSQMKTGLDVFAALPTLMNIGLVFHHLFLRYIDAL